MKKILISLFALNFSFGGFAQQNDTIVAEIGTKADSVPKITVLVGQFSSLGKVSFSTDSVWMISGNGITQIWSDAVQTDYCSNKTSFDGGRWYRDNDSLIRLELVDCRSNPNQKGDLFSGTAIVELKEELCPYPWRVPTVQDFIDLDIALGGTGDIQYENSALIDNYLNIWGGSYGGFFGNEFGSHNKILRDQGLNATYWSQTEIRGGWLNILSFNLDGCIFPNISTSKFNGYSLRCVRDN